MPFNASLANVGGELPSEIKSNLQSFINELDKQISELTRQAGLNASQIRLLRPCNIAYFVSSNTIFCVLSALFAGGVPLIRYTDVSQHQVDMPSAMHVAQRDLGFENMFGIEFPLSYIYSDQKVQLSERVIANYIKEEILLLEKLSKIVRINPIFLGRDFMINESKVFMLSPFSDPFNAIFNDHIKPIVESISGLSCNRADNIYDNRPIMEDIWRNINEARVIIAELTGRNPNVFYETGIAHTIGKEVILITQSMDDVPFDLRHLRCIVYDYTPPGVRTLENNLKNTLQTITSRS